MMPSRKEEKDRFEIVHWEDLIRGDVSFEKNLKVLYDYFEHNDQFKKSLVETSTSFIEKQKERGTLFLHPAEGIAKSNEYLLEEMAVFAGLAGTGYVNHVYPGETLKVLKDITSGAYADLETDLKNITYIELKV